MHDLTRRGLFRVGLASLGTWGAVSAAAPKASHSFHLDHVLGTSLDVQVRGGIPALTEATACNEIERLRRVFSTYDPDSELSRLNRSEGPFASSEDLRSVLSVYDTWREPTAGASSAQTGEMIHLWQEAARHGILPDEAALTAAARRAASVGWQMDGHWVTRAYGQSLNLNSVAKGYILHRAASAIAALPGVTGVLLNLGGDLMALGEWRVGVQDPFRHAENDEPLTTLRLNDRAIATSGGYQRFYRFAGAKRSHLIDPRTGHTADHLASATVVAPSGVVANLLATALCVLRPEQGLALVAHLPNVECLLVSAAGQIMRSAGFAALQEPKDEKKDAKPSLWPVGYQVTFDLEIPNPTTGRKARRPYVAIWIEDASGNAVRTVSVWGKSPRWLPTLSGWWKVAKDDKALVATNTRATRAPGKYTVAWDGKDDAGKPLPRGSYTVKVEVHREHGKHVFQTGKIDCGAEAATLTLEKNAETGDTIVKYGPRK